MFLIGFLSGAFVTFALIAWFISVLLLRRGPPRQEARVNTEVVKKRHSTAYPGPGIGALSTREETAEWLNVTLACLFVEVQQNDEIHRRLLETLLDTLNGPKRPSFVSSIEVTELDIGESLPSIRNILVERSTSEDAAEMDIYFDVDYSGCASIDVSADLMLNWPVPATAMLPVDMRISLTLVSGRMRIHVSGDRAEIGFSREPVVKLNVRTLIGRNESDNERRPSLHSTGSGGGTGDGDHDHDNFSHQRRHDDDDDDEGHGKHQVSIERVGSVVLSQVRSAIRRFAVWPHAISVAIPFKRAACPDPSTPTTNESNGLRRRDRV